MDLDKPEAFSALDAGGMARHLHHLPQQCLQAWEKGRGLGLPASYRRAKRVVVCGLGGSAIGGDLAAGVAQGVPLLVHRDYGAPPGLDRQTLAIFSSYSGMTEETLSSFRASLESPALKLAMTTGGRLGELARERGLPVFPIDYTAPPRAALGYSFLGLLGILEGLGFFPDQRSQIEEMARTLEEERQRWREGLPEKSNRAKALARQLLGRLPVIYGAGALVGVARRWKSQLNENSKTWAFYEALPELHHNSVVGYRLPPEIRERARVILLTSPLLSPRHRLRLEVTAEVLKQDGVAHEWVTGEGDGLLSQVMSLVYLGDWVSYYLAMLHDTDPSPNPNIDFIKGRLAQHPLEE